MGESLRIVDIWVGQGLASWSELNGDVAQAGYTIRWAAGGGHTISQSHSNEEEKIDP